MIKEIDQTAVMHHWQKQDQNICNSARELSNDFHQHLPSGLTRYDLHVFI